MSGTITLSTVGEPHSSQGRPTIGFSWADGEALPFPEICLDIGNLPLQVSHCELLILLGARWFRLAIAFPLTNRNKTLRHAVLAENAILIAILHVHPEWRPPTPQVRLYVETLWFGILSAVCGRSFNSEGQPNFPHVRVPPNSVN
jgi:hypothetical protein